jgi:DNA-binding transcriptional regulator GbsR (MarR family)
MNNELKFLSKSVGAFIKYWGFKSIHGEIWTYLYLRNRPMSSLELQTELEISKGLLSKSINELINYDLIEFVESIEHGRATYTAKESFFKVIQSVLNRRELILIDDTLDKIQKIEKVNLLQLKEAGIDLTRLKKVKKLTQYAQKTVIAITKFKDFSFKIFKSY